METIKNSLIIIMILCCLAFAQESKPIKVVIDAGHGGKDGGAVGVTGVKEKDICLEMALLLQKILVEKADIGITSLLTRSEDKFISLEERVAFANQSNADYFVSLHANSYQIKKDNGFEVYYHALAGDEASKDVTDRENTVVLDKNEKEETGHLFILWDLAQNEFLKESAELADIMQNSIDTAFNKGEDKKFSIKNRGVKQETFVVLRGVRTPAVLLEMGFISNENEEANFKNKDFKEKYVNALLDAMISFKQKYQKKTEIK